MGPDESAIRFLGDHGLPGGRLRLRFEGVQGLARTIMRVRLLGIVPNVVDRPAGSPPGFEQRRHIPLGLGIIAIAPARMVDGPL
jgi:hypothetical protein